LIELASARDEHGVDTALREFLPPAVVEPERLQEVLPHRGRKRIGASIEKDRDARRTDDEAAPREVRAEKMILALRALQVA
jgi:hypothetical protein